MEFQSLPSPRWGRGVGGEGELRHFQEMPRGQIERRVECQLGRRVHGEHGMKVKLNLEWIARFAILQTDADLFQTRLVAEDLVLEDSANAIVVGFIEPTQGRQVRQ